MSNTSTSSLPSASQTPTPIDTGIGAIIIGIIGGVSLLGLILITISVKFRRPHEQTQRHPMDRRVVDEQNGVRGNTNNATDGHDTGSGNDSSTITLARYKVDEETASMTGRTAVGSEASSFKGRDEAV